MIRDSAKSAPIELKLMWARISYNVTALHAAAKAETRVAVTQIAPRRQNQ